MQNGSWSTNLMVNEKYEKWSKNEGKNEGGHPQKIDLGEPNFIFRI